MYKVSNLGKEIKVEEIKYVVALNSRVGHRVYCVNENQIDTLSYNTFRDCPWDFVKHRFSKEYFLSKFLFDCRSTLYIFKDSNSLVTWLEQIPDGHKRKKALFDGFVQTI